MRRFIQLTDMHICSQGQESFQIDTKANFTALLSQAIRHQPDYLLLTGDFCFREPNTEIYSWVFDKLRETGITTFSIAGNHDSPEMLSEYAGRKDFLRGDYFYFSEKIEGEKWIFLDTSKGLMEDEQLNWLSNEVDQLPESLRRCFICMHHPPFDAGVPHMDQMYSFQTKNSFRKVLTSRPEIDFFIFSGHYHVDKTLSKGNMHVSITPSGFFQIDPNQDDFAIDHKRIAFRIIDIHEDHVSQTVRYFDGHDLSA